MAQASLLAFVLTAAVSARAQENMASYADTINQLVRFTLVYLEVSGTLPDGTTFPTTRGSGFLVSEDGHVVTAKHVAMTQTNWVTHAPRLLALQQNAKDFARAKFTYTGKLRKTDAAGFSLELRDVHDSADIAVLKVKTWSDRLNEKAWPILPIVPLTRANEGMPVAALGFPYAADWSERYGEDFTRKITYVGHLHDGNELVATNLWLQSGTSGGPVFNRRGHIVGVVYGGRDLSPTSFFTPGNVVVNFLNQLGIQR